MSAIDSLADSARRFATPRVLGILVVAALGVAGMWGLVAYGNAPEWVPIVQGVPLDAVAEAQRALEEAGIESDLSAAGTSVLVRAEQAARARVALAERGVALAATRPGFELFDEASWGMTDFTQRINYRRALEGELKRTIEQMRGISAAEVHLALPQTSSPLMRSQPVEASVLLAVAGGVRPTTEQVEAITFLVASSVDGLTSENVSVVDDAGRVLSAATEPGSSSGRQERRRLEMQLELEKYLEARAAELVEPLLGPANVRVRVSAQLDFEQVERRTQAVDPNQQVLTAEERSEVTPGDPSQGAASTIQHNTFDVTRSTEVSSRAPGRVERLSVAVALNEGVARAADPTFVARVRELVTNAVGLDPARGDVISVLAVPFEPVQPAIRDDTAPPPSALELLREFQRPILLVLALLMMFGLAFRGLSLARTALPAPERQSALAGTTHRPRLPGLDAQVGVLGETQGAQAPGRPTIEASRVVRAWLGEG